MKHKRRWIGTLFVLGVLTTGARAQRPALPPLASGLATTARVLIIGARPGDEDNALSAWLTYGHHVRTAFLSITRGESAPNANGPEGQLLLGMVRAAEMQVEQRAEGGGIYFTRAYDFGKQGPDSTVARAWPRDSVLEDVVTVIRAFRPQVVISLCSPDTSEHDAERRAAARLARMAFAVSADTLVMPALRTSRLGAWQPDAFFQEVDSGVAGDIAVDVGAVDASSGRTYAELGAALRAMRKSEPPQAAPVPGPAFRYLRRRVPTPPIVTGGPTGPRDGNVFAGVDTSWARFHELAAGEPVPGLIDSLGMALAHIGGMGGALDDTARTRDLEHMVTLGTWMRGELPCQRLAAMGCTGVRADLALSLDGVLARATAALIRERQVIVDATAEREAVAVGDSVGVTVRVYNGGQAPVRVATVGFSGAIGIGAAPWTSLPIDAGDTAVFRGFFHVNRMSLAWWALNGIIHGTEIYDAPTDVAHPVNDHLLAGGVDDWPGVARVSLWITDSTRISVAVPIVFRDSTQLRGDNKQPVAGVPAMSILLDRAREYVRANVPVDRIIRVSVSTARRTTDTVQVVLRLPTGVTADSANRRVVLEPFGSKTLAYRLRGMLVPGGYEVAANAIIQQRIPGTHPGDAPLLWRSSTNWGIVRLPYEHIPTQWFSEFARDSVQSVSLNLPMGMHVGVVGGGEKSDLRERLVELGVPADPLDPELLGTANLADFSALLLDPESAEDAAGIRDNADAIGRFAAAGGTVVVLGDGARVLGLGVLPYPMEFNGGDSTAVPDPQSPVTMLALGAAPLAGPIKIGVGDFAGWTMARAGELPSLYDPRYQPVLSMIDSRGLGTDAAILVTAEGRGRIIYTGLTLRLQMVAATNPGAARLLVALLTLTPLR